MRSMVEGARDQAVHCPFHRLRRSPSPALRGRMEKREARRTHRATSQVVTSSPVLGFLVSFSTTPMASSWSRMRSASEKSFA